MGENVAEAALLEEFVTDLRRPKPFHSAPFLDDDRNGKYVKGEEANFQMRATSIRGWRQRGHSLGVSL